MRSSLRLLDLCTFLITWTLANGSNAYGTFGGKTSASHISFTIGQALCARLLLDNFQIHSLEPHISPMSRNAFLLRVNHQLTRGKGIIISSVVAER